MKRIQDWFLLARLPFHSVGILPFVVGSILAYRTLHAVHIGVFIWGVLAVVLIMLATYFNGEAYDVREDTLSASKGKSLFAGGSQVVVRRRVDAGLVKKAGTICMALAVGCGLLIQFYYKTGIWTIPLGLSGIAAGYYYSKPPLRWVSRGFGEVMIAYCYGWLPVAVGFYLQAGSISPDLHLMSIPLALSIFNVILINEFPDYEADSQAGKRNLLVRIGKTAGSLVYSVAVVCSVLAFYFSTIQIGFVRAWHVYLPVAAVAGVVAVLMLLRCYRFRRMLEVMCACSIIVNLGTALAYFIGLMFP